jgi:hypothetical protein
LLEELLRTTHDRYKLILVTNLIILRDIDSVSVGNVLLRRVSEDYMTDWPQQHSSGGDSLFAALRLNSPIYESKQKFLEKNRDKTALEIEIEGFHLDDEQSPTFNAAVHGFRRVFAYLFLCECFLSNVKEEQYKIEKPKLLTFPPLFGPPMPWVEQLYYVRKSQDPTFIRAVTRPGGREYSQDAFVIGSELLAHLKKRCYLDKFNEIFVMGSFGEVGDKIARSVDWFLKAELEKDPTDVIMSLFISLEALLSLGSDPLMSLVDEMAENVAIMVQSTVDERYKWKRKFKKWYETRNDIVHRGKVIEEGFEWIARDLKISVVWSVMGILARMDNIVGYGSKSDAIKQYFDREKLK